jgi:hypothetical protein
LLNVAFVGNLDQQKFWQIPFGETPQSTTSEEKLA